jgi:CelD/BcsL family acetyltransferase involved in cellulose biosynthesis
LTARSRLPIHSAALTLEVIRDLDGLAGLQRDFEHLNALSANTLPFASFEWHATWCSHFLGQDPSIEDHPLYHVLRDPNGMCVAIIPWVLSKRRIGVLTATSVGLLGADPAITEIRTSLVLPGHERQVAAVLDSTLKTTSDWDWIQWQSPVDAFSEALGVQRSLQWQAMPPSYLLDLPATWDQFRAGLKRNIRESLRHGYNSLKRDGHQFEFIVATTREAVRRALGRLFELHAARAALTGTVDHPDRFANRTSREFVLDVCDQLAARDCLRVFQLVIAGQVVATRIGFVVGNSLYLYYSGFDPDWSRYGVMTTVVAEAIKYAIDQKLATVNLSPGTDVSKTRWGPREVHHVTAYEHSGRLHSRLVSRAYLTAKSGQGLPGWILNRLLPGRRSWS